MEENKRSHRIYDELQYPAHTVKVFLQIIIGLGITIALIVNVAALIGFIDVSPEADPVQWVKFAAEAHPLKIAAYGLGVSAGLEMAYMMFTPGIEGALEALLMALPAAALHFIVAFSDNALSAQWHSFLIMAVLLAAFPALLWSKQKFINRDDEQSNETGGS